MERRESLPLGIVVERRRLDNPWIDHDWRPVGVVAGLEPFDPEGEWRVLVEEEDATRYLAGTLPLELFPGETEAYRVSLSQHPPRVFVVLRPCEDTGGPHEVLPHLVTASPDEAQEYLDAGEDIVEAVAMPAEVIAAVRDFVERHHVETPFVKRKRKGKTDGSLAAGAQSAGPAETPRKGPPRGANTR